MMLKQKSMFSLFLALVASVMLHVSDIPYWAIGLTLGVVLWRYLAYRLGFRLPGAIVKAGMVSTGFYGVFYSYGAHLSIEAMVTLLVAGVALKPLEVQKTSESYLLVFLCFLLQGMHFLFDQSPLHYFYVLLCFVLTIFSLIVVNQNELTDDLNVRRSVRVSIKIFFLSLPLTIFLFFVLPRLGPLWSLNISTKSGVVGLSESMSPGDLSSLGRSSDLAFRVSFDGDVPPMGERYWRALILDYYDGVEWSRRYQPEVNWNATASGLGDYQYQITLEPHDKKWMFALANSRPITHGIGVVENGTLLNRRNLVGASQYSVASKKNGVWQNEEMGVLARQAYLQYPKSINKGAQQLAEELALGVTSLQGLLGKFKNYFFTNPFSYTLNPGTLESSSRVDQFLFSSKKGFCAHYAGSLVYMLRSLGIPSRVVVGYLGGEINQVANYYSVYQYDAHAWVEVWVEEKGWYRVDPTGWVSPERVEQGIEQAVSEEFAGFRTESKILKDLYAQMQALNFYWQDWMLSYKGERQQKLLDSLWGKRSPLEMFLIISLGFALTIGVVFFFLFFKRLEKKTKVQKLHSYWLDRLRKQGVDVLKSDSFDVIALKTIELNKDVKPEVLLLNTILNDMVYSQSQFEMGLWRQLKLKRMISRITK